MNDSLEMPAGPAAPAAGAVSEADVDFDGARPISRRFGDIYYDADGAAAAAQVLLEPAAVAARSRDRGGTFTVGEFGFGTGLNFIVTAAACRARLHFISFERYPLKAADLARALAPWRHAYPMARSLEAAYPPPIPGWHRRFFDSGRVQLSLYWGDVQAGMDDLAGQQRRGVDAWFLDGFAPPRNPDMWRARLFHAMARLSAPGATVTTFTAAGQVRRGLSEAAFEVRRVNQMPRKRHTTAAVFTGTGRVFTPPPGVVVIGAGIAGAATAGALADKGIATVLVDRGDGIARGASAVPAAVMHMRLLASAPGCAAGAPPATLESGYRAHAYTFATSRCRSEPGVSLTGALQLPGPNAAAERLRRIVAVMPRGLARYLEPAAAARLAGIAVGRPGLLFPDALTITGRAFAAGFAERDRVEVAAVAPDNGCPVVHATGVPGAGFEFLEVAWLAGQLDRFACPTLPRLPLVGGGVLVPAAASVWTGATYEHRAWHPGRATAANAERYQGVFGHPPGASLQRFRGARAITSDRLPIIGRDAQRWFNLGHGSHGMTTAILGAEIVASGLNGEVAPVTAGILGLLDPGRFRERQRKRPNPLRR